MKNRLLEKVKKALQIQCHAVKLFVVTSESEYRGGGSVVENTQDYQSRGCKIAPPASLDF